MIVSQTLIPKMYNVYIALAVHVWLLIFWLVDLGLVANLAAMWGRGDYCFTTYNGCMYSLSCIDWKDHQLTYPNSWLHLLLFQAFCDQERYDNLRCILRNSDGGSNLCCHPTASRILTITFQPLTASSVTWALTGVLLVVAWNTQRTSGTTNAHANPAAPPQYQNNGQAVPLEKYDQPNAGQYAAPQTQYASPQPQYAQPAQPQFAGAPYAQDPVQRQDTVSPVSHAGGYTQSSVSGVSSPLHTGQHAYPPAQQAYPPNAAEVHTDPYNPNVPELANHK